MLKHLKSKIIIFLIILIFIITCSAPTYSSLISEQVIFLWILSDSNSHQGSRNLLRILANLNNAEVSILQLISNSSTFFQVFGNCSTCTNYNWNHCHPHVLCCFISWARSSIYLSFYFILFIFFTVICQNGKIYKIANSFFLFIYTRSDLSAGIRWSICFSKFQRILCLIL